MSAMTVAERLVAAADLLDQRAWAATAGPWVEAGIGEYGWSVISGGDQRSNFGVETEDSEQGKADAAWIARMHPEIGKSLAVALRSSARIAAQAKARKAKPPRHIERLVELADLLLAEES